MQQLENKKVLITGGAGFIGSNLAEYLLNKGCEIVIIDDLSDGCLENIQDFKDKVEFIQEDITESKQLLRVSKGCNAIIHLAAIVSVQDSIEFPFYSNSVNIEGTLTILEAARMNNIKKVILASSAAVYGEYNSAINESFHANPINPYGLQKLTSEHYCRIYSEMYGIETLCLRFFNVYGEKQNKYSLYSGVITKFVNKILKNQKPVIYGNGLQVRDFVYVKDVCEVISQSIKKDFQVNYDVINLGTSISTNLIELVQIINKINGSDYQPVFEDSRAGDIKVSIADNSRLIETYKIKFTSLEKGLRNYIDFVKANK